ncbi:unnamed protein product, partial [Mesorhabditis belari]|uniref:Uncharacterized protein n=1 Tax=Mesorhabditis belari TaxID=2138241 RepID=A0AAF3F6K4_9BILA
MGCDRDPSLPFCAKVEPNLDDSPTQIVVRTERATESASEKDRVACHELRQEYSEKCEHERREPDFCQAFENICVRLGESPALTNSRVQSELSPLGEAAADADAEDRIFRKKTGESSENEPIPIAAPTATNKKKKKRINFTSFCKEFKNRYLYICPDPFRFGQKAVLFCPIYSDHCHVPLPGKPVLPQRKSKGTSVARLCAAYRGYAENYCNNAFFLSQPRYRDGCEKYWRFCLRRNQG